jgi:hypothetical protein
LPGISYTRASWNSALRLPHPADLGIKKASGIVVLCYKLVAGNSAAQPFILETTPATSGDSPTCANINPSKPLLMNQILVVAIDMTAIPNDVLSRVKLLNLNITNQQGASLNPTPIRPSLAAGTASGPEVGGQDFMDLADILQVNAAAAGDKVCYLTWPNQMPGDTIPTVSVNLIYTPVAPALPFQPNTFYPAGSIVTPNSGGATPTTNGHYYVALNSGISSGSAPNFDSARVDIPTFQEGAGIVWKDMGLVGAAPAPQPWAASTAYAAGAQVTATPANGHYYQAQTAGATQLNGPPFPVDGTTVIETAGLKYIDVGSTMPAGAKVKAWAPQSAYFIGDAILSPSSGHYYSVIQAGLSGSSQPTFTVPAPKVVADGAMQWEDLGTALSSSVSAGTPPSDQTVNLLTYTFPQAHALSYFNLAAGVVVSSIKNRTFTNAGAGGTWSTAIGGRTVDPILAVTAYVFGPMDAERPWRPRDLVPGVTLGFSLTSPSTNFYIGGSSEFFIRNLQLMYGFAFNRVSTLDPAMQSVGSSAPTTRQIFAKGGFVGLSFNITGFIQSLF